MNVDDPKVDVVDFLKAQHQEIRSLAETVKSTAGEDQRDAFACLVRLLAVHETAEEEVIHPLARGADGGAEVVERRIAEERAAKATLASLEKLDVGSAEFTAAFTKFAGDVAAHAANEEAEEFPLLQRDHGSQELQRVQRVVKLAQDSAPTHPHPHGPDGAVGNLLVGPFVALVDRVRDLLRGEH